MTMPTDVKLNAEGVEAAREVLIAQQEYHYDRTPDNLASFEQQASEIIRAYLAAIDNSKPTPAVGDDGVIERLRQSRDEALDAEDAAKDCFWAIYPKYLELGGTPIPNPSRSAALAAAHSQHEADVARIAELTEALRPFMPEQEMAEILWRDMPDGATGSVTVQLRDFRRARSALAKVKP